MKLLSIVPTALLLCCHISPLTFGLFDTIQTSSSTLLFTPAAVGVASHQVLSSLLGSIPTAKNNMILFLLREGKNDEAWKLSEDVDPQVPHDYIVKVTDRCMGHHHGHARYGNAHW